LVAGLVVAAGVAVLPWRPRLAPHPLAFEADLEPTRVEDRVDAAFSARRGRLIALGERATLEQALELDDRLSEALRQTGAEVQTLTDLLPSARTQGERLLRARTQGAELRTRLTHTLAEAGLRPDLCAPFLAALARPAPATLAELMATDLAFAARVHLAKTERGYAIAIYARTEPARRAEAEHAVHEAGGQVAGAPVVEAEIARLLASDLHRVTALSVAAVALLLVLYYRRALPVALVLSPLACAWAAFVLCAPRLSLWNLVALPLCIGYGIDDHIFLVGRFREGASPGQALRLAGRAVALTSLATLAGFGSLALAELSGVRSLGAAGALAVGTCFLSALTVLPALLGVVSTRTREPDHTANS
jgi:predicted exporter